MSILTKSEIQSILERLPSPKVGTLCDRLNEGDAAIEMIDDVLSVTNAKHVLEIGTHLGCSTTLLLSRGVIQVTTVDILGDWVSAEQHSKMKHILETEFENHIKFLVGDSTEIGVIPEQKYDLIFIDGDHSYSYVKKDIETGLRLKVPFYLLDDYTTCEDVRRAALDKGLVFIKEYPRVHNPAGIGLALFRIP